jgi:hypothetical protein
MCHALANAGDAGRRCREKSEGVRALSCTCGGLWSRTFDPEETCARDGRPGLPRAATTSRIDSMPRLLGTYGFLPISAPRSPRLGDITIVIPLMKGLFLKCVDRRATRMGFVIEIRSDPRLNLEVQMVSRQHPLRYTYT